MSYPAWYYRVKTLRELRGDEFEADHKSDFDEDLSDLTESEDMESDDNEGSHVDDEENRGMNENEEGDGEDYDSEEVDFEHLKDERHGRKLSMKDKNRALKEEAAREEEVDNAYQAVMEAEEESRTIPIGPLCGEFYLYCASHCDRFYDEYKPMKVLRIKPAMDHGRRRRGRNEEARVLQAELTLDHMVDCETERFRRPRHASRRSHMVNCTDGPQLEFQFLGNGCLTLRVPWRTAFDNWEDENVSRPPYVPEWYEFSGIWKDPEKAKTLREQGPQQDTRGGVRRRSASPKESYFNMYHPAGDLYDEVGAHYGGGW